MVVGADEWHDALTALGELTGDVVVLSEFVVGFIDLLDAIEVDLDRGFESGLVVSHRLAWHGAEGADGGLAFGGISILQPRGGGAHVLHVDGSFFLGVERRKKCQKQEGEFFHELVWVVFLRLEGETPSPRLHAWDREAAGVLFHLGGGNFTALGDGFLHAFEDEVLEEINVGGIDHGWIDADV